ncbi:hypothetical protein B0J11DRAFT_590106 [Dendryphion nanum]|uniref:DUF6594 domain-containing protein n=1 Tax=Dendryphion nanum TaxID=256645 RepID=A0A9P9DMD1_9PLEO|nr:hypothetical protein B0J11DRAFT_590106 [Dendryphion nanum]
MANSILNSPQCTAHGRESSSSKGLPISGDAIINIDSRATTVVNLTPDCSEKASLKLSKVARNDLESGTLTIPLQDYQPGYPQQAAFQSSDHSFSIYRGFNYLHSRVILELQDELRCLEKDLNSMDKMDTKNGKSERVTARAKDLSWARREGKPSKRAELLEKIRSKLVNYDEVLVKARELNTFQRPSKRDYRSIRRWFSMEKPLSYSQEEEFIRRKEDLVTLRQGREWAGFDGLIEELIRKCHCKLTQKLFATPELREKTNNECIYYYSASRIEKLVGLIITLVVFILLVLPVVAMYKLTCIGNRNSTFDAVGVLVVFTLLFSAAMSLLTKAKRHELFAASAAYCAVLVVFISNFNNSNGGPLHGMPPSS